ncbi:MAG: DUF4124 domain-containing protein [Porticoccaceae bacterium]
MALPIKVRLGVALLLAFVTPLAGAETVYKWVDQHGVTQFSTLPPTDRSAEKLKVEAPETATGATAEAPSPAGNDARPKVVTEDVANSSAADLAREEAQRNENCATAKRNLESLNTRPHVRIKDEKTGEDRYLTPDERAQWKKESALRIDEYCKPARR